jgi:hypothetical protein
MTLAIMQPYLFPYIGYWQLVYSVDTFVIMEDLNYIKQGYINRNCILVNGEAQRITLELMHASQNRLMTEIEIGNNREVLLQTIERAYKHAPYFHDVFPLIKTVLEFPEKNLAKFISNSIEKISSFLGLETKIVHSCDFERDHRLKAQDMVLDICKRFKAANYINTIGGQKLYSSEVFKEHGVNLNFIEPEIVEYKQFNNKFVPRLSIIDVMMFNSPLEIDKMLKKFVCIEGNLALYRGSARTACTADC